MKIQERRFVIEVQAESAQVLRSLDLDYVYHKLAEEFNANGYSAFMRKWMLSDDIKRWFGKSDQTPAYLYRLCQLKIGVNTKEMLQEMAKKDGGLKIKRV